ncbi:penicillin-binding protein 1B [Ectothiorhodospiraceae bacterium 2226]|nr:penicillin-binding protein 1B [Ectothiorhodospiraceae bacterium 2226]
MPRTTKRRPSSRKRPKKSATPPAGPSVLRWLLWLTLPLLAVALAAGFAYTLYLDHLVSSRFEGQRWAVPARVYARSLEVYPGAPVSAEQFANELQRLGYRDDGAAAQQGSYARTGNVFQLVTRPYRHWDGREPSRRVRVEFDAAGVRSLGSLPDARAVDLVRLEPPHIASIYPSHHEDRVLVRLNEVPPLLVQALLAVEDRQFYDHHGILPRAIARAALANLRAGRTVQGGSTLTQQLVKNFYLDNRRAYTRKFNEAAMALLLEWRYDKDEILEAYLNEIYLGQDGRRAIHGFGLASRFYFGQPLDELDAGQIALLVALARGASFYDPRRHPQRARERRDLVLELMAREGYLDAATARRAAAAPLGVLERPPGINRYPAFLDLVRRQLRAHYREQDLSSEGLQIYTTLDPFAQQAAERAVRERMQGRAQAAELQAAAVITSVPHAEVLALVGGRDPRFAGFNRALDAVRPIGSLIKPAIYLTALEQGNYSLVSSLRDEPITLEGPRGEHWTPQNFDGRFEGPMPLYRALAESRNLPAVWLGLDLGVPNVLRTLQRLGVERRINPYPAALLGSVNLSPLEVAQAYQTLANGGFHAPLRAIREVTTADGQPLERYPLAISQVVEPGPAYLINTALQLAVSEGTGRALYRHLPREAAVAGKTGTTNDQRDAWFAGYTGDRLGVVWVGTDDNRSTGLTGSSGALPIWGDMIGAVAMRPLHLPPPEDIEMVWIARQSLLRASADCAQAMSLPFRAATAPADWDACAGYQPERGNGGWNWLRGLFQ